MTKIINGVNVEQLMQTVQAVKAQPELANFQFRSSNDWLGGSRNCSTIQDFRGTGQDDRKRAEPFRMVADEPPVLLGQDTGANPVEYVLHALAACMTTTMAYHAAANGIYIESIESELEGDLDLRGFLGLSQAVRKGFQQIRIRFNVTSDAAAARLKDLAQFSPVFDIVTNPVPVQVEISTTSTSAVAAGGRS